jgi:hypothetical protein
MIISFRDELAQAEPAIRNTLEYNYRGFTIGKKPAYNLLFVQPPEGKRLVKALEGDFSGPRVLEVTLNSFLETHTVEEAYQEIPPEKPKRGRPKASSKVVKLEYDDGAIV